MNRRYFFGVIAITLLSVFLIFASMWKSAVPPAPPPPISPHPIAPFESYLSGAGVVEASSDNISIGTPVNRIVDRVWVQTGETVAKGALLLTLENRDLQADLKARKIDYEIAKAKLKKMEALPRKEDVESAQAALQSAQIAVEEAKEQYEMANSLHDPRALSLQELNRRRFSYEEAQARVDEAQAHLRKVQAGSWKPDLEIAALEVAQAKASLDRSEAEINRTIIRSPIEGKVLQIKIHEGESPVGVNALMIVGNTDEMYLKVSINQFDAPFFRSDAQAAAFLRGNTQIEFRLDFVRLLPFLVNKDTFTNDIMDKTDTRVLQVIYKIKNSPANLFVGQQMDVYIEAPDEHR